MTVSHGAPQSIRQPNHQVSETERTPRVWVLAGQRAGDRAQLIGLAQQLGWPFQVKELRYNLLNQLPNLLLGASKLSLNRGESSELAPPWPDLILDCGRRSVPVARWIHAQTAGRSGRVHLGRPWAPYDWFDLIVSTPQYGLPPAPNLVQLTLPFHTVSAERLAAAGATWHQRLANLPRPWTAVLVGGNSTSHVFGPDAAVRLARQINAIANGGALLISTSRRTPPAAADALRGAVTVPHYFHRWRENELDNPYLAFLDLADRMVVTSDSASMIAEACVAGKPVGLFALDGRPGIVLGLSRLAERGLPGAFDRLVRMGVFMPARDMARFQQALLARGMVGRLNGASKISRRPDGGEAKAVVKRIKDMMAKKPTGNS